MKRLVRTTAVCLMSGLAACGGSGESSGGGGGPPGQPPSSSLVALTTTNMRTVAEAALVVTDPLLPLVEVVAAQVRLVASSAGLDRTVDCEAGGSVRLVLTDTDQNGRPGPGDSLRMVFAGCQTGWFRKRLTGEVRVALQSAQGALEAWAGEIRAVGQLRIEWLVMGAFEQEFSGGIGFEWRREEARTETFVRTAQADDAVLTWVSGSERIAERILAPTLYKRIDYSSGRIENAAAFTLESSRIGGRVTVSATAPLAGYLNTFPDAGQWRITGEGGSRIDFTPSATGSGAATYRLDTNGDGTYEGSVGTDVTLLSNGYLWWEPISRPAVVGSFGISAYQSNDFGLLFRDPESLGSRPLTSVRPRIVFQFSRPLATNMAFNAIFATYPQGNSGPRVEVRGQVQVNGARLVFIPEQQLQQGLDYQLTYGLNEFIDTRGNRLMATLYQFTTRNNLQAVITTPPVVHIGTGSFALDGSASVSADGPITAWRWRQVAGTAALIATPASATTQVTPAAGAAAEHLVFELEVSNGAGEAAVRTIDAHVFATADDVAVMYYRSPVDSPGGSRTVLQSSASGTIQVNPYYATADHLHNAGYFVGHGDSANKYIHFQVAGPGNAPLVPGAYENAVRYLGYVMAQPSMGHSNSDSFGCNNIVGRFDVLDAAQDPDGTVQRLAIDYEQHCESSTAAPLFGSIRYRSGLPLRY
jgi:hypothetical protein